MIASTEENRQLTLKKEAEVQEALAAVQSRLAIIGNLVHDSVPVSNDEVCEVLLILRNLCAPMMNNFLYE